MVIRMPAAGSRPINTSQNGCFEVTPEPSGAGHVICGASRIGGPGGTDRAAGLRVCATANPDVARKRVKDKTTEQTEFTEPNRIGFCDLCDLCGTRMRSV